MHASFEERQPRSAAHVLHLRIDLARRQQCDRSRRVVPHGHLVVVLGTVTKPTHTHTHTHKCPHRTLNNDVCFRETHWPSPLLWPASHFTHDEHFLSISIHSCASVATLSYLSNLGACDLHPTHKMEHHSRVCSREGIF